MQKIFLWGTGFIAEQVFGQCSMEEYDILGFIDNNPKIWGKPYKNSKVFPPDILYNARPDKIVILTDYYDEIRNQIIRMLPDMGNFIENKNYFYKQSILKRYENTSDPEIVDILRYIREKELSVFNYEFTDKYKNMVVDVEYDSKCGMYYTCHQGKKLYFAKFLDTKLKVEEYYKALLMEQDADSPHKYLTPEFDVKEGNVVVDIGVAEGNFSLDIVDKASKVYLIETDINWVEALRETFKEYQEKVVVIQKFVSSINEGRKATLDQLVEEPVDFIKMDIEGNEWDALLGAEMLFHKSNSLKCAICSYHADFDEVLIKDILRGYGMDCSTTPGYMWFPTMLRQTYVSTKLCRGIVRGAK